MTPSLEKVKEAIKAAQCPGREGPYGLYDYSGYGWSKPYRVRDFRDPDSASWGGDAFISDDRDEAYAAFERLTEEHIARAALNSLLPPSPEMVEAMWKGIGEGWERGDDLTSDDLLGGFIAAIRSITEGEG